MEAVDVILLLFTSYFLFDIKFKIDIIQRLKRLETIINDNGEKNDLLTYSLKNIGDNLINK